ncbi:MAG: type II secretory pathway pseudopilin PulG [Verrucomicrobiales bacterium]|jgi:type II secretory pathway pseudopilin PulG
MKAARPRNSGYILFEVLIAITIFAIAFAGLVKALGQTINASNDLAIQRQLRFGLESILTEARHQDLENMGIEYVDDRLGVTYRTSVDQLQLANTDGQALTGMYALKATVSDNANANLILRKAEVWIYEDERSGGGR